jgi:hypothetical protein
MKNLKSSQLDVETSKLWPHTIPHKQHYTQNSASVSKTPLKTKIIMPQHIRAEHRRPFKIWRLQKQP